MELSETTILAIVIFVVLGIAIVLLLLYIVKLRRKLQGQTERQRQISSVITGLDETIAVPSKNQSPRKQAKLYDGSDNSTSSSMTSLHKTMTRTSTLTNTSPLRTSTTDQDLQQHFPSSEKSPKRLTRPRLSIGIVLKNMQSSRPGSASTPTTVRDETVIDKRKVFALPAFLRIETIDDNIELTDPIAKGSFGDIWKGELRSDELLAKNHGRPYCAVKIAIDDWNTDERFTEILKAFRQEVTIIHTLSPHPNIISIIGYTESPDRDLIIVEELCDFSLSDLIHKQLEEKLLMEDIFIIFAGIVDGLSWMHRHGVIHNDLKPQNVLINVRGSLNYIEPTSIRRVRGLAKSASQSSLVYADSDTNAFIRIWENFSSPRYLPKICDMGVTTIDTPPTLTPVDKKRQSLILEAMQNYKYPIRPRDSRISKTMTDRSAAYSSNVAPMVAGEQKSAIKGFSARYASPEQIKFMDKFGKKDAALVQNDVSEVAAVDFITRSKSDIWPLGVIAWEMMERKHPYVYMSKEELKSASMNDTLKPLEFGTSLLSDSNSYLVQFLKEKAMMCMQINPSSRPASETLLQNCLSAGTKANTEDVLK